jgi:hypothetical protein
MNINNKLIKRQRLPKGQSTIQRKWQGTQDEGAIKDGQSRENDRLHIFKILSLSSTSLFLADLEWDSICSNV